jgi:hypothetical protein
MVAANPAIAGQTTKMPNAAPVLGNAVAPPPVTRRFEIADLFKHGGWILRRLQKARPSLSEAQLMQWLKSVIYSNEHLFLYQEHGCALAQTVREETLAGLPVVRERFVFAEEGHAEAAADFYDHILQWAKNQGVVTIIVEEMTDVPHDLIKEKLGRLFERKQVFARV